MIRRTAFALWYAFAGLVVLAAVVLSGARMLLPHVPDYRETVIDMVREGTGQEVEMGAIDAVWRGLGPALKVTDFALLDPESRTPILEVDVLWLHLDLWRTLTRGKLSASGASLVGLDLDVTRSPEGRLSIEGFTARPHTDFRKALSVIMGVRRLQLLDTRLRWLDHTRQTPSFRLLDLEAALEHDGARHRLTLDAALPEHYGEDIHFVLEVKGPALEPARWRGTAYLAVANAQLSNWASWFPDRSLEAEGRADIRFWLGLADGALQSLATVWQAEGLRLVSALRPEAAPFALENTSGRLRWERKAAGWQLVADRLEWMRDEESWPAGKLQLRFQPGSQGRVRWSGSADFLNLADLRDLLLHWPWLADEPRQWLNGLALRGQIAPLRFVLDWRDGRLLDGRVEASFRDLGAEPWNDWPGVSGLQGHLDGDLRQGALVLSSRGLGVHAPALFRSAQAFDVLEGTLRWQRYQDRWRVHGEGLRLENADLALNAQAMLDLPSGETSSLPTPLIDLQVGLQRAELSRLSRYLPAAIMSPKAVSWFDQAFEAGQATGGGLVWRGPVGGFPYPERRGRFEARVQVADAALRYRPDWLPIRDLEAEVVFVGAGMEVQAGAGRLGDARIESLRVHTADLGRQGSPLQVEGRVAGPLPGMLAYLEPSPLGERYPALVRGFETRGPARLRLALQVPLRRHHSPFSVDGVLSLERARIRPRAAELTIDEVQGRFHFTKRSLDAEDVSARVYDRPVRVSARTRQEGGAPAYEILAEGELGLGDVFPDQAGTALLSRAEGRSLWRSMVKISRPGPKAGAAVGLILESQLQGTAIHLPVPFAKPKGEARPIRIQHQFAGPGAPWRLQYGEQVSAAFAVAGQAGERRLERGELRLGGTEARLPDRPRLRLAGELAWFSLADWQPLLGGAGDASLPPLDVELKLDGFALFDHRGQDLTLVGAQRGEDWIFALVGPTAQGRLQLVRSGGRLQRLELDLDHLLLASAGDGATSAAGRLDPRRLPGLKVRIARLKFGDKSFGAAELVTHRRTEGMEVERLHLKSGDYDFTAKGQWVVDPAGEQVSRFEMDLKKGKIGDLLERFGYERSIEGRPLEATMLANWPGTPMDFSLATVQGEAKVSLGPGRIIRVEPGAGRVLGLLSLQTLQRRLSLDFSDLVEEGLGFDSISGHLTFLDGDMYTNDLLMKGPSADVEVAGRTGIARRDYDQLITVIPHVSSNLPVAGMLAGGPAVGAALFIADRLVGRSVDRLAQVQYELTGTWGDPKMERLTADTWEPSGGE